MDLSTELSFVASRFIGSPRTTMMKYFTFLLLLGATVPALAQKNVYVDAANTDATTKDGTNWTNAFVELRNAISNAYNGDTIFVKVGTYKPANNRDSSFRIKPGLLVYGGFPSTETGTSTLKDRPKNFTKPTLSGDIGTAGTHTDNCYHVVTFLPSNTAAVLDGFIVERGRADGSGSNSDGIYRNYGGGIYVSSSNAFTTLVRLRNLEVRHNYSSGQAGGVFMQDGTITHSLIHNNRSGGVGAGVFLSAATASNLVVYSNTQEGNGAAGIYLEAFSVLYNSTIYNNRARSGSFVGTGGVELRTSSKVYNCIVYGNSGRPRGGNNGQDVFISNGTFQYNLVKGSSSSDIVGTPTGGFTGCVFTNTSPFASTSTSNAKFLRLSATSAAINAGTNSQLGGATTDLDGNPRTVGTVDMGAYEDPPRPTISAVGTPAISITEDTSPAGAKLNTYATVSPIETGGNVFYKITGSDGTPDLGTWQYRKDATATWKAVPTAGIATLTADSLVRFLPAVRKNTVGISNANKPTLTVKAIEGGVESSSSVSIVVTIADDGVDKVYVDAANTDATTKDGTNWTNAFVELRNAINDTQSGDTIFVKVGTYKPANNRDASFRIKPGLLVYGGFPSTETGTSTLKDRPKGFTKPTLSGDIGTAGTHTDNCYHVVTVPSSNVTTVLDGFIIERGQADGSGAHSIDNNIYRNSGGGVNSQSSKAVLRNLEVRHNYANGTGGGVRIDEGTITHSIIHNNRSENVGSGMYMDGAAASNLVVHSNTQEVSGEGGIRLLASTLYNSTIYNNRGRSRAGGLHIRAGSSVYNCIIYGNSGSPADVDIWNGTFQYNLVKGSSSSVVSGTPTGGFTGCVFTNTSPFASTSTSNAKFLRLSDTSPAKDVGTNAQLGGATTDLDGNPRISNQTVDMGAYEDPLRPTVSAVGTPAIAITEDTSPAGAKLNTYATVSPIETGGNVFYKITGSDGTPDLGTWQYRKNTTATWKAVPTAGIATLTADSLVRFLPAVRKNTVGISNANKPTLTVKAIEGGVESSSSVAVVVTIADDGVDKLYVDAANGNATTKDGTNWTNAYVSLTAAIAETQSGDTIFVKVGTYKPANNRDSSFRIKPGLLVYGGFPSTETGTSTLKDRPKGFTKPTLSGDIGTAGTHTDNCYHVVTVPASNVTTVLDGFIVERGQADGSGTHPIDDDIYRDYGGGVYLDGPIFGTNLTRLRNLEVRHNYAEGQAGGLFMEGGTLTHSLIHNNSTEGAGAGVFLSAATASNLVVYSNTQEGNGAAGIYLESSAVLYNSTIYNNRAQSGSFVGTGGVELRTSSKVYNCIVYGNSGRPRSGFNGQDVYIVNGTFQYNLVKGSSSSDIVGTPTGGFTGCVFTNTSPFASTSTDNAKFLRLSTSSPAIDAGTNSQVGGATIDLDGNPRIKNVTVDMGAYEFLVERPTISAVGTPAISITEDTDPAGAKLKTYATVSASPADGDVFYKVTGSDGTPDLGTWQYRKDATATWKAVPSAGIATLTGDSLVRFLPAANRNTVGVDDANKPTLTIKAIENNIESASSVAVAVTIANDETDVAHILSTSITEITIDEDADPNPGTALGDLGVVFQAETSGAAAVFYSVSGTDGTGDLGTWQYKDISLSTTTWTALGAGLNSLLAGDSVRFVPGADLNTASVAEKPKLTLKAYDGSESATSVEIALTITSIADAPTITATQAAQDGINLALPDANTGATLSTYATIADGDGTTPTYTISSFKDQSKGTWQYSTDGSTWTDLDASSLPNDLVAANKIRFSATNTTGDGNYPEVAIKAYSTDAPNLSEDSVKLSVSITRPPVFVDAASTYDQSQSDVGSAWNKAYDLLHIAIAAASDDAYIFVKAGGTFKATSGADANDGGKTKRDSVFRIDKRIYIYGGMAGTETGTSAQILAARPTDFVKDTLSGDIGVLGTHSDNSKNLVSLEADGAIIDGFVLERATSTAINITSNATARHLRIRHSGGRGAYLANGTLSHSRIHNNGGGVHMTGGTVSHNRIHNNSATNGAGVDMSGGRLYNNLIYRNQGGGGGSDAQGGGIRVTKGLIIHNTIYGNTVDVGGGIYIDDVANHWDVQIVNNISYGNTGWRHEPAFPPFFPEEHFDEIYNDNNSNKRSLAYNNLVKGRLGVEDLPENLAQSGNIRTDRDPFVNAGAGDFRLLGGLAVNTGATDRVPSDLTTDFAGNARIVGGLVDIGAYESAHTGRGAIYVKADGDDSNGGRSWADAFATLHRALRYGALGDSIFVKGGETHYTTTGTNRDSSFVLRDGLHVYGGFAGTETSVAGRSGSERTILSGDISSGDDNDAYHVVTASKYTHGGVGSAVLDGFKITGGKGTGSGSDRDKGGGIYVSGGSPILRNLEVTGNSATYEGGGVVLRDGVLSHSLIHGNSLSTTTASVKGGGVWLRGGRLSHSAIYGNTATAVGVHSAQGGGLAQEGGTSVNNTLYGNTATAASTSNARGGGLYLNSSSAEVYNTLIYGNSTGGEVYNTNSGTSFEHNLVRWVDSDADDVVDLGEAISGTALSSTLGCIFTSLDPYESTTSGADGFLHLGEGSLATNKGDGSRLLSGEVKDLAGAVRVLGVRVDIGAYESTKLPRIIYVNSQVGRTNGDGTSWSLAYDSLHEALTDARAGDSIFVMGGTNNIHKPSGSARSGSLTLKSRVYIYGGFSSDTQTTLGARPSNFTRSVLSGDIGVIGTHTDNSYHVVHVPSGVSTAVLDGFEVRDGRATGEPLGRQKGGGLWVEGEATLANLDIHSNEALEGGGVYMGAATATLSHSDVRLNSTGTATGSSGGGLYLMSGEVHHVRVYSNTAEDGGGVYLSGGSFLNSEVYNNTASSMGGGIYLGSGTAAYHRIHGNVSATGGGAHLVDGVTLHNSLIYGNSASVLGGGVHIGGGTLRNVTIYNNTATDNDADSHDEKGGGLGIASDVASGSVIANVLLYDNGLATGVAVANGSEIYNGNVSVANSPILASSLVKGAGRTGAVRGVSNQSIRILSTLFTSVSAGQVFVEHSNSTATNFLQLRTGSPGINRGGNSYVSRGELDLAGSVRIQSGYVDVGAYESGFAHAATRIYVSLDATGEGTGVSWTNAYTDLGAALAIALPKDSVFVKGGGLFKLSSKTSDIIESDRQLSFTIKDDVHVYGGFRGSVGEVGLSHRPASFEKDTLDGSFGVADSAYHVVRVPSGVSRMTLDGFVIRGGRADGDGNDGHGGGIYAEGAGIFSNLIIRDNYASSSGGGIYLSGGFLRQSVLYDNYGGKGGGVYLKGGEVQSSTIYGNGSVYGGGLLIASDVGSGARVVNSILYGNRAEEAAKGHVLYNENTTTGRVSLTYSLLSSASESAAHQGVVGKALTVTSPVLYSVASATTIFVSVDKGSGNFLQLAPFSIATQQGSNSLLVGLRYDLAGGSRIQGGTVDLGAYESSRLASGRIYVAGGVVGGDGTSWALAYDSLQLALGVAYAGDSIFVKGGVTYQPTSSTRRTESFVLDKDVHVYGGFSGTEATLGERPSAFERSVLSGDIGVSITTQGDATDAGYGDNSYHVVHITSGGVGAVLDGFVITGGAATGSGTDEDKGGGLFIEGDAMLSQLEVRHNISSSKGGGVYMSAGRLTDAQVHANTAASSTGAGQGGGLYMTGGDVLLSRLYSNKVSTTSGHSTGGGLYMTGGVIAHSILYSNSVSTTSTSHNSQGGGVGMTGGSLINNTLHNNLSSAATDANARGYGLYINGSGAVVANTIIYDNSTTDSQEVWNGHGSATFTHNLVKWVDTDSDDVVDLGESVSGTAFNSTPGCVFSEHTSTELFLSTDASATSYLHLAVGAYVINRGSDSYLLTDEGGIKAGYELDLKGGIRIQGGAVDMGAFEGIYTPRIVYVRKDSPASRANQNGSTWGLAYDSLQVAIAAAFAGDSIFVKGGETHYTHSSSRDTYFSLRSSIGIYGGFLGTESHLRDRSASIVHTTLSADIGNPITKQPSDNDYFDDTGFDDNGYHVVHVPSGVTRAVLDGFILEGGSTHSSNDGRSRGGGALVEGSAVFTNLIIRYNKSLQNNQNDGGGLFVNDGVNFRLSYSEVHHNKAKDGGGLYVGGGTTITHTRIHNNEGLAHGGGLRISGGSLRNSLVYANVGRSGGGVHINSSSALSIINCTIYKNDAGQSNGVGGGLDIHGTKPVLIANSILVSNNANSNASGHDVRNIRGGVSFIHNLVGAGGVRGTAFTDQRGTIYSSASLSALFLESTDPTSGSFLRLRFTSPAANAGTSEVLDGDGNNLLILDGTDLAGFPRIRGGVIDIGAFEGSREANLIFYVDAGVLDGDGNPKRDGDGSSWASAYDSLHEAISAAFGGDSIFVRGGGVFKPTHDGDRDRAFALRSNVGIYGGFIGTESHLYERPSPLSSTFVADTLSGNIGRLDRTNDNSYHVVRVGSSVRGAVLDGFVLRGGSATGSGDHRDSGGGLLVEGEASLRHLTIRGNGATSNGGGVYVRGSSQAHLRHITVTDNTAGNDGGGVVLDAGGSLLSESIIRGNSARYGGGLYVWAGHADRVRVYDNSASDWGGGVVMQGDSLTNSVVYGNQTTQATGDGGGIFVRAARGVVSLVNNTIHGNTSMDLGGGVYISTHGNIDRSLLANNIIYGNTGGSDADDGDEVRCDRSGVGFSHNLVKGSTSSGAIKGSLPTSIGTSGNIFSEVSPFLGTDASDASTYLRLSQSSLAVNAGADSRVSLGRDLVGSVRIQRGRVDIGAYESAYAPTLLLYVRSDIEKTDGDGSSWANAYDSLHEAIAASGLSYVAETIIYVKVGTYKLHPSSGYVTDAKRAKTFRLGSNVKIYGGFVGTESSLSDRGSDFTKSVLSGSFGGGRAYHVVTVPPGVQNSVLDGFVVRDGQANGDGTSEDRGGGLLVQGNATLRHLELRNNEAVFGGGGAYLSAGVLSHSVIHSNNVDVTAQHGSSGNVGDDSGGGVFLLGGTLSHSVIHSNRSTDGKGVYVGGGVLAHSLIHSNTGSAGAGGGVRFVHGRMFNCTLHGNSAGRGGGLYIDGGVLSTETIGNSLIYGNSVGNATHGHEVKNDYTGEGLGPIFTHNLVKGANQAQAIRGAFGKLQVRRCIFTTATIDGIFAEYSDKSATNYLHLSGSSPAINRGLNGLLGDEGLDLAGGSRIVSDIVDIGAFEGGAYMTHLWFVDSEVASGGKKDGSSWVHAFDSLHLALDWALASDSIFVKTTTTPYRVQPPGTSIVNRQLSFTLNQDVYVYGGFSGTEAQLSDRANGFTKSVLSGDIGVGVQNRGLSTETGYDDNSYHVVRVPSGVTDAVLDGFIVEDGNALEVLGDYSLRSGGGLLVEGGARLSNLEVRYNSGMGAGGISLAGGVLTESELHHNVGSRVGGLHILSGSVTRSELHSNTGGIGGVLLVEGSFSHNEVYSHTGRGIAIEGGVASYNEVYDNTGGGALLRGGSLTHSMLWGNVGDNSGGGGVHISAGLLSNSLLHSNTDSLGGGLYVSGGRSVNNTIYGNRADDGDGSKHEEAGGGLYISADVVSSSLVANTLLYGNGLASSVDVGQGAEVYNANSDVGRTATFANNVVKGSSRAVLKGVSGHVLEEVSVFYTDAVASDVFKSVALNSTTGRPTEPDDFMRLADGSPAHQRGSNSYIGEGVIKDLGGGPRIVSLVVDVGAYEGGLYTSKRIYVNADVSTGGKQNGENWDPDAYVDLYRALEESLPTDSVFVKGGGLFKLSAKTSGISESDRRRSFTLKQDVYVYGGFLGTETGDGILGLRPSVFLKDTLEGSFGIADSAYHVVRVPSGVSGSGLDGFVIRRGRADGTGSDSRGAGIYCEGVGTFSNLEVYANQSVGDGAGVYLSGGALRQSVIHHNVSIEGKGGGVYLGGGSVLGSTLHGNSARTGGGILIASSVEGSAVIGNTIFYGNQAANALLGFEVYNEKKSSPVSFSHNLVRGASESDAIRGIDQNHVLEVESSIWASGSSARVFSSLDRTDGGYLRLSSFSLASQKGSIALLGDLFYDIVGSSRIQGGALDIGAYESARLPHATFYIDPSVSGGDGTSWVSAYGDPVDVLSGAYAGDSIFVKKGYLFRPTTGSDRGRSFVLNTGVGFYGGFAGTETHLSQRPSPFGSTFVPDTLSGDIGTIGAITDNSYHVVHIPSGVSGVVLDGFVVLGGSATGAGVDEANGGGLLVQGEATLRHLRLRDNEATSQGGGAYLGGGRLIHSFVHDNEAISTTSAQGGGVYLSGGSLVNNVFYKNKSGMHGGGISVAGGTLLNNTLYGDTASVKGGGLYIDGATASVLVANTLVYGSEGGSAADGHAVYNARTASTHINFVHNLVHGADAPSAIRGTSLEDVLGSVFTEGDPFASTDLSDSDYLGIGDSSPAAQGGVTEVLGSDGTNLIHLPSLDLSGSSRIQGGLVDIGAYESSRRRHTYFVDAGVSSSDGDGSTWSSAYDSLHKALGVAFSGDSVFVKGGGVFKATKKADRSASFVLRSGVGVYGGFVGSEAHLSERPSPFASTFVSDTLSGDIGVLGDHTDNSYHVVVVPSEARGVVLEGFVVLGGSATGSETGQANGGGLYVEGDATLRHLRLRDNEATSQGGGAYMERGRLLHSYVHDNEATSTTSAQGGGVYLSGGSLVNSLFYKNESGMHGGGISIAGGVLLNNTVYGDTAKVQGGGLYIDGTTESVLVANTLLYGSEAGSAANGHLVYNGRTASTHITFAHNLVEGSDQADALRGTSMSTIRPVYTTAAPTEVFLSVQAGAVDYLHLTSASPASQGGTSEVLGTDGVNRIVLPVFDLAGISRIRGGVVDIGAYEGERLRQIFYVDAGVSGSSGDGLSWSNAYDSLHKALGGAFTGDSVFVKGGGVFKPTNKADRDATFRLNSGVAVYGGFRGSEAHLFQRPSPTEATFVADTLSGDIGTIGSNGDNSYHVVVVPSGAEGVVLDGFVIEDGHANGSGSDRNNGGGLLVKGEATLRYLTIRNNRADNDGGGVVLNADAAILSHSSLLNNHSKYGGGLYVWRGKATHLRIANNSASGVSGALQVGGSAGGGAFLQSGHLVNSLLYGNRATHIRGNGGGVALQAGVGAVQLINNTIYNNSSNHRAGGLWVSDATQVSRSLVANTILYGNTAGQGAGEMSALAPLIMGENAPVRFENNLVKGANARAAIGGILPDNVNTSGNVFTTVAATSIFASSSDATADNYLHLAAGSPAIDAGSSSHVPTGITTDLAGGARSVGEQVDMGAFEYFVIQTLTNLAITPASPSVLHGTVANTAVGTLSAVATGLGDSPELGYEIVNWTSSHTFKIDGNTLRTNQEIDIADGTSHTFDVRASYTFQSGEVLHSDPLSVTVSVLQPSITSIQLTGRVVQAGSPQNTRIGTLTASGENLGSGVVFTITEGNTNNNFRIAGNALQVAKAQMPATPETYQLKFSASFGGATYTTPSAITIRVIEPKVINITGIQLSNTRVEHDEAVGHVVGVFAATGEGLPDDGRADVNFTFEGGSKEKDIFRIVGGDLRLKATPGAVGTQYRFKVRATYLGVESSLVDFTVQVTGVTFTGILLSGTMQVRDGEAAGTEVGTLSATGTDLPTNGVGIVYSITGGNSPETFEIDGATLKVKTPPDRATKNAYDLQIKASYLGVESSAFTFTITITRAIRITGIQLTGNREVSDGAAAGTEVGDLSATGTSIPVDGSGIVYTITGGNEPETFEIDGAKLKVKVPPVRSTKASYDLQITASYSRVESEAVTFTITITEVVRITGIRLSGNREVSDGSAIGTEVGVLSAAGTGLPSDGSGIVYSITGGNEPETFEIEGDKLKVKVPPVRSTKSAYTLQIKASYSGVESDAVPFAITITEGDQGNVLQVPSSSDIRLYPNPTRGIVHIVGLRIGDRLRVLSSDGEAVWVGSTHRLDLRHLPDGVYIVEVIGINQSVRYTLIKR